MEDGESFRTQSDFTSIEQQAAAAQIEHVAAESQSLLRIVALLVAHRLRS